MGQQKDDDNDNTTMTKDIFSVVHQSTKYGGHSCVKFPPNLCKTQVLLDILSKETQRPRVVYIGDGSNDVCPAINALEEGDVLLANWCPAVVYLLGAWEKNYVILCRVFLMKTHNLSRVYCISY